MDIGEILLILLFLVFPLLQQLLQKRSPPPPPLDPEEEEGTSPMELEPVPDLAPEPGEGASRPAERREGSMETAEALSRREVLNEREAAELTVLQSRLPAETVPEAVRVSSPVVSMESLRVERPAKPPRTPLRAEPLPLPSPSRPLAGLGPALHGKAQLRRAVLLSEVLGPPKSLE